jgi:hypothetical protein
MSNRNHFPAAVAGGLASSLLILLFVYAAAVKLAGFDAFARQLARQPFRPGADNFLLYALPIAELLAAGLLFFSKTRAAGLRLSLILLVLFTGYVGLAALHLWNQMPCPCGGILGRLPWRWHLVFNAGCLLLNVLAIQLDLKERRMTA